jgi:hypothetical protein
MFLHSETLKLLVAALEASVYAAPREPGLSREELFEVGRRHGRKDGEIGDAINELSRQGAGAGGQWRWMLPDIWFTTAWWLGIGEEPELRNPSAFDFVYGELSELARNVGIAKAHLDRATLVARAAARSLSAHDVEYAVTLLVLGKRLIEKDGTLGFAGTTVPAEMPSSGLEDRRGPGTPKLLRTQVLPTVQDVIARRSDGRSKSAEPFDAFAAQLERLGYAPFGLWWKLLVQELRRTDPSASPLSALVLAAAVVEGALAFVVEPARKLGSGVFGSDSFKDVPQTWKLAELVKGAARGGAAAILDERTRAQALDLNEARQRIHAGRMLSKFPQGVPDLRPEEARAGRGTAELVVRRVVDWLEKNPIE